MTFTHLEVHSHYTLLAATPSVPELVARAQADGLTHLALTDTNALYGAVAFDRACRAAGIRPIIGMTVTTLTPDPSPVATGEGRSAAAGEGRSSATGEGRSAAAGHLVLLAMNPAGYRSLCRLSSLIQGGPDREALAARGLTWEDIAAHREGLICLSGGRMGWIERFLRAGDLSAAQLYAGRLAGIFEENAYLALEIHTPADEAVAAEVVTLGRRLGLPTAAVQPIYCLSSEDAPKLRLLAAIRENRRLHEAEVEDEAEVEAESEDEFEAATAYEKARPPRSGIEALAGHSPYPHRPAEASIPKARLGEAAPPYDGHWLSPAEIAARYGRFPQAVSQVAEIAARCQPCLPDGRPIWPSLKLPAGQTPDEALADLAWAGSSKLEAQSTKREADSTSPIPDSTSPIPAFHARLQHELAAIARHGYAPLFLVVADIVRFAHQQEIPVSTRGSVANSLVAYCIGITTVDPIAHDLLFERFLNPARANPPDIDLDFCSRRRDEVLRYVRDAYGASHVALVGTVSTLRPQSAVRETGKAFGLAEAQIDRLVGLLPHSWHPDPRRRDKRTAADVLAALTDPLEHEVVRIAYTLLGQPDHLSVHPGAVVITPGPLTDVAPVQWAPKGFLITQFEHGDVEALGLPKMDLLGIRALTVLADAAELVRRDHDPAFHLAEIPLDDAPTADLLARAETIGVFQCESDGAQRTLRKLKARTVADLAVANAFFKPGPAMGGMATAFVRRYRGEEAVSYLHPALQPILGRTKGVLIFQEQILRLAREIAGLTWEQADHLRRGMSHFGAEEMAALHDQFVAGCLRPAPVGHGFTPAQAQTLWEQIMPFAGYGFNQGHATAYADVSYRSAYLKAHYPAEFLCARLADWGGFHHPAIYMAEAVRLGFAVRPPHVNYSGEAFTLTTTHPSPIGHPTSYTPQSTFHILYMGLGQVRDLRQAAIAAIVHERGRGAFRDLRDLLNRAPLRPKELDHLIRAGALDGLGESRAELLAEAETIRHSGGAAQMPFDFARPQVIPEPLAQRWAWETELLGLPVSALADPLALVKERLPEHTPLVALPGLRGRPTVVAGVRLPGWTGGQGFFLSDGPTFVIARGPRDLKTPPAWQPLLIRGRWQAEDWGAAWLQAESIRAVGAGQEA